MTTGNKATTNSTYNVKLGIKDLKIDMWWLVHLKQIFEAE